MSDDTNTTQDEVISTDLGLGEEGTIDTNPDGLDAAFNDALGDLFDEVEEESPSEVSEEQSDPEVSEEEGDEASDDESVESEDEVAENEDGELDVVDFDEMKQFKFEVGGKHYSANDIKAAFGQLAKQEEAKLEVETAQKALEEEKAQLEQLKSNVGAQQQLGAAQQQIAQLQNYHQQLQEQRKKAVEENDSHTLVMLGEKERVVNQKYNEIQEQVQYHQQQAAQLAAQKLEDYGLGALNTDTQRQEAFRDYAFSNVPQGLISVVNTNPELLAMVEKARLYDKANSEAPKGKLKGAKRTLKAGAAKTAKKKSKNTSYDDAINSVIDDLFKS